MKVQKANVQQIVELSGIQKGMLFSYLKTPNSNPYNVQIALNISGELDVNTFGLAVKQVQQTNEALRSVFNWELSKPVQIILKATPLDFEKVDVQQDPALIDELTRKDWEQRFDLTEVAFKVRLYQQSPATYALVITCHHLLYDGWSNGILLGELFAHYGQMLKGVKATVHKKLSLSQARSMETPEEAATYWKHYLADAEPTTTFSPLNQGNQSVTFKTKHYTYSKAPLEVWAATNNVTVASVLYAAYAVLLWKLSGKSEVIFGTTVSNRDTSKSGMDAVLDNFINTLPLRVSTSEIDFKELVRTVSKQLQEREKFAGTAYQEIKEWMGLSPSTDLFDSVMVIENYPIDKDGLEQATGLDISLRGVKEKTDIPLLINVLYADQLEFQLAYHTDLVNSSLVEALPQYFSRLLDALIKEENTSLSAMEIISPEEKNRLLNDFNKTWDDYPAEKSIPQVFDGQARKTPQRVSITYGGQSLTYEAVRIFSDKFACYLSQLGVAPGDKVGIMLERELLLIPAIYGILKAGAAYVPIDPNYPSIRTKKIISSADIQVLITREALMSTDIEVNAVVDLTNDREKIDASEITVMPAGPKGSDLAYVIYTSGSTGEPKGVMIEHHSVINRLLWMQHTYPITDQDVLIQKTPITFDVSVWELFWWSFVGASVTMLQPGGEKDPATLHQSVKESGVTTMHYVPSMLSGFLMYMESLEEDERTDMQSVRLVFASGEALKHQHVGSFGQWLHHPFKTRLVNLYGPTEATVDVSHYECEFSDIPKIIPIGKPVANTQLYILNEDRQLCPVGVPGELMISGVQLSRGYVNQLDLTNEKFQDHPFQQGAKMYKSGDRACWLPDGNIQYLGRIDDQIKLRGLRIELGEIEYQLQQFEGIHESVAVVTSHHSNESLAAYYTSEKELSAELLKKHLTAHLPAYMVPSHFMKLDAIPLSANGKLNRKALPQPLVASAKTSPDNINDQEKKMLGLWVQVLGHDQITADGNFFDLGGDSIKLITLSARIKKEFNQEVSVTALFDHPTLHTMVSLLGGNREQVVEQTTVQPEKKTAIANQEIAVIGMAGRFPGANNIHEFWHNLTNGIEGVKREEESDQEDGKVHAKGKLKDYDAFDHGFFGYNPAEAQSMDPQMRLLHECAWETLEEAGYNPFAYAKSIGLYAGASPNPFFSSMNLSDEDGWVEQWQNMTYAHKDYLCTRVSYALNLKGPSVNLSTACSTSLVAIDEACNDLLAGKCDMALAGGVSVTLHDENGYKYHPGMILSPDGKCRAFDQEAAGTVGGNGVGMVLLKPLEKAITDGDQIHAVIKASAKNNDGNEKVGFTAPSISGQAAVISEAIAKANVPAETITYVETHGTGTKLGDPIEIEGLKRAFATDKQQFCAIGAVKASIGHLDAAAGVAGFIKTVLALKNKTIPKSLHFDQPNEAINFKDSPFYVNQQLQEWKNGVHPRRAGVSSFGIGGTNAHVIVEEAPKRTQVPTERKHHVIPFAAKSSEALNEYGKQLAQYLEATPDLNLADVAYSLQKRLPDFPFRKQVVFADIDGLITALKEQKDELVEATGKGKPKVVFMFSGQGSQYRGMCKELYASYPEFKSAVDQGFSTFKSLTGKDLKTVVFAEEGEEVNHTEYAQPALFIIEYALTQYLNRWGIRPDYLMGHSLGEYVAACMAGLFSFEDGLKMVIKRGQIMQQVAPGSMLSVNLPEEEITRLLTDQLDLAAVNSSNACVVSGTEEDIRSFKTLLDEQGHTNKLLPTSHAFHSYMLEGVLDEFKQVVDNVAFQTPQLPVIANLTGTIAEPETMATTDYWVQHLRHTVKFARGVEVLLDRDETMVFIEIGPGNVLTNLVRNHANHTETHALIATVRHNKQNVSDQSFLLQSIGKAWESKIFVDWLNYYNLEKRNVISLPGYAFERIKFPVSIHTSKSEQPTNLLQKPKAKEDWFHAPIWKTTTAAQVTDSVKKSNSLLVFDHHNGMGKAIQKQLQEKSIPVSLLEYKGKGVNIKTLLAGLPKGSQFDRLIYLTAELDEGSALVDAATQQLSDFSSVMKAVYASDYLSNASALVVTNEAQSILGIEKNESSQAGLMSFSKVVAQEYGIDTSCLDLSQKDVESPSISAGLLTLLLAAKGGQVCAYRNNRIWSRSYEPYQSSPSEASTPWKTEGKYLITGGLGQLGYLLAQHLLDNHQAKVLLTGRSSLDENSEKGERLKSLQALGEVSYQACDIASVNDLKQVVASYEEIHGTLNGVIHAAGLVGGNSINLIEELSEEHYKAQLSVKFGGLQSLYEVLGNHSLEVCLVISSISSILGGVRFGAYASANAVMDHAFLKMQETPGYQAWKLINFDALDFTSKSELALHASEIIEVIEHATTQVDLLQVVVGAGDLVARSQQLSVAGDQENEENEAEGKQTLEERLLHIWRDFFGMTRLKNSDDFFELGGDSLKAITLLGRINNRLKTNVSVTDFFKFPTVKSLTGYLDKTDQESTENVAPIPAVEEKTYYQLSSVQRRLYFLFEFDPASTAYNMPMMLEVSGKLDVDRLETAAQQLIARHESLRTRITLVEGQPMMQIQPKVEFKVQQLNSSKHLKQTIDDFIQPFDLATAPLIRIGLIPKSADTYILLVDLHHIITDAVSKKILINDFVAFYQSEEREAVKLNFKDFSEWQNSEIQQQEIQAQKQFWLDEFSEEFQALELPTDFSRPLIKTNHGGTHEFVLSEVHTTAIKHMAASHGLTDFMLLLGLYNLFLRKLSGQDDIVIGTPIAGRDHEDLEEIVGMFVNTLPIFLEGASTLTVSDFLQQVKEKTLTCFNHQRYPYELLVDELKLERDTSRNPLFDTEFSFENFEKSKIELPELIIEPVDYTHPIAQFDMELSGYELDGQFHFTFRYATDLFQARTIERFATYFIELVGQVTIDPTLKLQDINLIPEVEKDLLLNDYNQTVAPLDPTETFWDLFMRAVDAHPDAIAVIHNEEALTYTAVADRAKKLSKLMVDHPCAHKRVVLYMTRSIDMLIGILAAYRAGWAYIPIDDENPISRVREIIADSEAGLVLTTSEMDAPFKVFEEELPHLNAVLYVDQLPINEWEAPEDNWERTSEDLAYIIYTSGTTGKPKGVMVKQLGMINHIDAKIEDLSMTAKDVVAQSASAGFDISVWQFLAALTNGGQIVIVDKAIVTDPLRLVQELNNRAITILESVPSLMTAMLDDLKIEHDIELSSLRWMIPTGEALRADLAIKWYGQFPDIPLINAYGPTECSDDITHYIVPTPKDAGDAISVGTPIRNTKIYILDEKGRLCPIGVRGEICAAGAGVGLGYWNLPEKTAAVFVPNPYAEPGYEMLYRTGDRGFITETGEIFCLGRKDDQIKIRGNRIEMGEITSQINQFPGVNDAATIAVGEGSNQYLVGYYIAQETLDEQGLKAYLEEHLPAYMVPAYYVRLSHLPTTSRGKLDTHALPQPERKQEAYIAPVTQEEKILEEVWAQVLGLEQVSVTESFFAIGGDSIKSIQISSRLRSKGYLITVKDIFLNQNIKALALKMKEVNDQESIQVSGKSKVTPIQQWFFDLELADSNHFNQSVLLKFSNAQTRADLAKVLNQLINHHDGLKARFTQIDGAWYQNIEAEDLQVALEEISVVNSTDPKEEIIQFGNSLQRSLDIENGPLVKVGLIHGQAESWVLIVIHHLIMDGVSWRVVLEDLDQLLRQQPGEELSLPSKSDAYLDLPNRIEAYQDAAKAEEAKAYWNALLAQRYDALPSDQMDGVNDTGVGTVQVQLPMELSNQLKNEANQAYQTRVDDLVLAALSQSLREFYTLEDLLIHVEGHGRDTELTETFNQTVGWFTVIYPVWLKQVGEDPGTLIKSVKEAIRQVPNAGFDYLLHPQAREKDFTDGQLVINYLGQIDLTAAENAFEVVWDMPTEDVNPGNVVFDWEVVSWFAGGQFHIKINYHAAKFKEGTVKKFLEIMETHMEQLVAHSVGKDKPELTPSDLTFSQLPDSLVEELQQRYDLQDIYPLSPMQEGMLFHALANPESEDYFEQIRFKINGPFDVSLMEQSLQKLVQQYDVLRTIFLSDVHESPIQVVLNQKPVEFVIRDIQDELAYATIDDILDKYLAENKKGKFDLAQDSLIRVSILKVSEEENWCIWSHHHIIMDGWCLSVLINELNDIYGALLQGDSLHKSANASYGQYLNWLQQQDTSLATDYWKNHLNGYDKSVSLPKQGLTGDVDSNKVKTQSLSLSTTETTELHQVSRELAVTLNTVIQSAWAMLMARYNNVDDIVFGSVVSGRPPELEGVESMIGLFINTVPVRINLNQEQAISTIIRAVQENALEAEQFHYQNLADIQSATSLGNSLITNLVIFENFPLADELKSGEGTGHQFEMSDVEVYEQTNYDLALIVVPGEQLTFQLDYREGVYPDWLIEQATTHFRQILNQISGSVNSKMAEVVLEKDPILHSVDMNEEVAMSPLYLIEQQVQQHPQAVALSDATTTMTYQEMWDWSDRIATYLKTSEGVQQGGLIGIMMERTPELILWVLGVLRSGATYVPIDKAYPQERVNAIIEGSELTTLISDDNQELAINREIKSINSQSLWEALKLVIPTEESIQIKAKDLAYVMFTSGSTGNPKGVMISHGALCNYVTWAAQQYVPEGPVKFPLFTSIAFDLTVTSIYVPLATGSEIITYAEQVDQMTLEQVLLDDQVNVMKLTPSHLKVLRNSHMVSSDSKLQRFIVGGEALETRLAEEIHQMFDGKVEIYNEYGPTEASVGCMIYRYQSGSASNTVPIGRAIINTQMYLLDQWKQPVPKGAIGEVYIAGKSLAEGYYNNAEATEQSFIPNPFNTTEKWYKSGDLAMQLENGDLVFEGRVDEQVKIRGHRVELGEIEHHVSSYALIKEAKIVTSSHPDTQLVGYYLAEESVDPGPLRLYLQERMPAYMIPAYFIHLAEFPLTANGKLDSRALPGIEEAFDKALATPTNQLEVDLVEVWAHVLGLSKSLISIEKSFYDMGGDSIRMVRLNSAIRNTLNIEITIPELFRYPTISALAAHILSGGKEADTTEISEEVSEMEDLLGLIND